VLLPFAASARCAPPTGTVDNSSSSLGIRFVATGLLKCSSGWTSGINTRTTATGDARSYIVDLNAAIHQEITCHQHSDIFMGCQLSRRLNSSSACLSIRLAMDEHPPTWRTWFKRQRRHMAELRTAQPATMTLLSGGRDWSSANVPSPSLHHASGISCRQKIKLLQTLKSHTRIENAFVLGNLPAVKLMIRRRRQSNSHLWNIEKAAGHYVGSEIVLLLLLLLLLNQLKHT